MDKKEKNTIYILSGILIIMVFCIVFIVVNINFKEYFSEEDKRYKEFSKVDSYIESHELNVIKNDENFIENIALPKNFQFTKNNVNIGDILKEKNEFSKKAGYNFEDDLGTKVDMIYYKMEGSSNYLIVLLANEKIIGIWIDKAEKNENKIVTEDFIKVMKSMAA